MQITYLHNEFGGLSEISYYWEAEFSSFLNFRRRFNNLTKRYHKLQRICTFDVLITKHLFLPWAIVLPIFNATRIATISVFMLQWNYTETYISRVLSQKMEGCKVTLVLYSMMQLNMKWDYSAIPSLEEQYECKGHLLVRNAMPTFTVHIANLLN